jgi:hypothetical protein
MEFDFEQDLQNLKRLVTSSFFSNFLCGRGRDINATLPHWCARDDNFGPLYSLIAGDFDYLGFDIYKVSWYVVNIIAHDPKFVFALEDRIKTGCDIFKIGTKDLSKPINSSLFKDSLGYRNSALLHLLAKINVGVPKIVIAKETREWDSISQKARELIENFNQDNVIKVLWNENEEFLRINIPGRRTRWDSCDFIHVLPNYLVVLDEVPETSNFLRSVSESVKTELKKCGRLDNSCARIIKNSLPHGKDYLKALLEMELPSQFYEHYFEWKREDLLSFCRA